MGDSEEDRNDMSDSRTTDHAEESSWTMYLGDFLIDNTKKSSLISSDNTTSSLVSDATSSITRVFGDGTRTTSCKRVSSKKMESKDSIIQDTLEDTASSLNCPKSKILRPKNDFSDHAWVCNKHPTYIPTKAKQSTLDRTHMRKDLVIARDDGRLTMKESGPRLVPPSTYGGEA